MGNSNGSSGGRLEVIGGKYLADSSLRKNYTDLIAFAVKGGSVQLRGGVRVDMIGGPTIPCVTGAQILGTNQSALVELHGATFRLVAGSPNAKCVDIATNSPVVNQIVAFGGSGSGVNGDWIRDVAAVPGSIS